MLRGLLGYLMWTAVLLGLSVMAFDCFAGSDTAKFEWLAHDLNYVDVALPPEGYLLVWGTAPRVFTTHLRITEPEIIDGKVVYTVKNLPNQTVYFMLSAWATHPDPDIDDEIYSKWTYTITRYVGPPIDPKVPQDGTAEEIYSVAGHE